MKTFILSALIGLLSFGFSFEANAQRAYTTTVASKSITAADTITMTNVEGGVVAFEYNATETSGTTAGKIYLEGKLFSSWVKLDSATLTDVATIQTMRTFLTNTSYKDYRLINTNTSSSTQTILAGYVRRPGAREPEPWPVAYNVPISQYADVQISNWKYNYTISKVHNGREYLARRSFVI
jgi:hypothetical protein